MLNDFFVTLYGTTDSTYTGIIVPVHTPAVVPESIAIGMKVLRGPAPFSSELFAIHSVKIVEASTLSGELSRYDARTTIDTSKLGVNEQNSVVFISKIIGEADLQVTVTAKFSDLATVIRDATLDAEKAAAILCGVVRILHGE